MRVVFVHGACVKDGAWWWHPTADLLAERGVSSEAPALPSCGETGGLPEVGESLSSFGGEAPAPFLEIDPVGGTFTVRSDALAETFLQDCDPDVQREAGGKLARQSLAVLGQPVQASAWQRVPTTYLVCAQDRGTPAERQRHFAAKAGTVVEFDAGHHPFLSQPAAVSDLVLGLLSAGGKVSPDHRDLLLKAYAAYNGQHLEALLALVSDDLDWPDGAARLHGKEQVRAYWSEQWTRVRAHDEPSRIRELHDGRVAVDVDQVVRSLDGSVLSRSRFVHVHRIEGHRIAHMDIQAVIGP